MVNEAPKTYKLGPGTLRLGETGTAVDYAMQATGATVSWDKDKDDDVPVLSGGLLAGDTTYTATLAGNVFQDLDSATPGLVEYTWTNKGTEVPVEFIPATSAGMRVVGVVIIDPLDVGGEEVKKRPRSDFEWSFVGEPTLEAVPVP